MERKPEIRPSFYKIFNEDYTNKLSLPQYFVMKYEKILPERAKLRNSAGETWNVQLEETEYEKCCFIGGWAKFVADLKLESGELLLFWYNINESTFDVSVYGRNFCVREIPATVDADEDFIRFMNPCGNVPDGDQRRWRSCTPEREDAGTDHNRETNPRFGVRMTENRRSRLCIPKKFAEAAGLVGKRAVVLEYPPKQKSWHVVLVRRRIPGFCLVMTAGWNIFRKQNGLEHGKTYSFEFDRTRNVIRVREEKE